MFAWEKYKRVEGQKTNPRKTQLQTLKLCKHVVKPGGPKGKELPGESDQLSVEATACTGPGLPGKGGRAGTKTGHPGQRPTVSSTSRKQPSRGRDCGAQGLQMPRFNWQRQKLPGEQTLSFPPP